MQLSLSFCSVQLRSHIGHIMVSFASQISLLQYDRKIKVIKTLVAFPRHSEVMPFTFSVC